MSKTDLPPELLELLGKHTGMDKMPTPEEIKAQLAEQEMEIMQNFKKLETQEIIKMLVAAENYLTHVWRSDPALTRKNHSALHNARTLITCVLDGKKPDNYDDLGKVKL